MTPRVINRLTKQGKTVVAEVPASTDDRRGWVEVIPRPDGGFVINLFEVLKSLDLERHISPEDLLNERRFQVDGLDAVIAELSSMGIDSGILVPPWEVEFPL